MSTEAILGLFGISNIITLLLTSWVNRRKTRADTDSAVVQQYKSLVEDLQKHIAKLEEKIAAMEKKLDVLSKAAQTAPLDSPLRSLVTALNILK